MILYHCLEIMVQYHKKGGIFLKHNKNESDTFKQAVKGFCKINNIPPRKIKFEIISDIVTINIQNNLEDGVDFECFSILNFIFQIISPSGIKFNQQLTLYPDFKRIDNITISFEKKEYDSLNFKLKNGTPNN